MTIWDELDADGGSGNCAKSVEDEANIVPWYLPSKVCREPQGGSGGGPSGQSGGHDAVCHMWTCGSCKWRTVLPVGPAGACALVRVDNKGRKLKQKSLGVQVTVNEPGDEGGRATKVERRPAPAAASTRGGAAATLKDDGEQKAVHGGSGQRTQQEMRRKKQIQEEKRLLRNVKPQKRKRQHAAKPSQPQPQGGSLYDLFSRL